MEARDCAQRMAELEERYHVLYRRAVEDRKWIGTLATDPEGSRQDELNRARAMLEQADRERAAILRAIEAIEDRLLD
jgi:hypothetical protein